MGEMDGICYLPTMKTYENQAFSILFLKHGTIVYLYLHEWLICMVN